MRQIEKNIIDSFRLAKSDMIKLQNRVIEISQTQERIMEILDKLRLGKSTSTLSKESAPRKKTIIKKTIVIKGKSKGSHKIYLAPKDGKIFHLKNCPFAQNIKPKNKIIFKTKIKALNKGYKPCKCVK